ncbi:MAG: endo-1,4-beta-xylanase, partial [Bacteroidota bacterium]|nr:endo-1,4-beta-xylanase [Bacteroidota bacterium]
MKTTKISIFLLMAFTMLSQLNAQTTAWYNSAQARIDTLRKGNFTVRIIDSQGQGVKDSVKLVFKKHDFPWGYSIDLSYGNSNSSVYGSSTSNAIKSVYGDEAVYQSERWGKYVAYLLPVTKGLTYQLTLKFAEIYFSTPDSRVFDVYIDGVRVLRNFDKYAKANGKNVAYDTTFTVTALSTNLKIECLASKDNASINGLVLAESTGSSMLRLNCGGSTIVSGGKTYYSDSPYLNSASAKLIPTDDDWYKAIMLKYCNYGVCGNQFKWSGIEPTKGILNYAPFENTLSWFNKVGWNMRAHTLLWGGNNNTDYHCIPQWVMNLSLTPKVMYDTCRMRVMREVTRYRGIVKEYDVLNEPTHANYLQKIVGDSIDWNCFKWAHEADPDAKLFVNDYNIIEWQDQTNNFVSLVKKMLLNGAPISGIGSQCHIGSSVDVVNFKSRFDQLAQLGLPIKITEFDMGAKSLTQQQYAIEMGKMLRLAFSHPAIEGFIFWGMTEPTWVPETIVNVIREDKTTKIAADTIYNLIHHVWTTNINGVTDETGSLAFNGYYGDYDVLVKVNGVWEKHAIGCHKAEKGKIFSLVEGTGVAPSPRLKGVKIVEPDEIHLFFDKKMSDPANCVNLFKVFDSKLNYVSAAALKPGDSTMVILTTNSRINSKDYVPVSYAPGTYTSADGGLVEAFGPIIDEQLKPTYLSAGTTTDGKTVQINFDTQLIDSTAKADDFIVNVNGQPDRVVSTSLNTLKNSVLLNLSSQLLKKTDVVNVTYLSGSLKRTDNIYVTAFDTKSVTNNVLAPAVVSATTSTTGSMIYLTFNQTLADSTVQDSDFMLTLSSGADIRILNARLNLADKRKVNVAVTSYLQKGDTIYVVYKPGMLRASTGIPATAFSYKVINLSTALEVADGASVRFYPSLVKDQLVIEHVEAFDDVNLIDLNGTVALHEHISARPSIVI